MASSTGVDVAHPTYPADDEKAVVGRAQSERSSSIRSMGHGDGTARKLKSRHSKLLPEANFTPPHHPQCQTCAVIVGCFTGYLECVVKLQLVR